MSFLPPAVHRLPATAGLQAICDRVKRKLLPSNVLTDIYVKEDFHVYPRVRARELCDRVMRSTHDHGEPRIVFIDRIHEANNLLKDSKLWMAT